MVYLGEVLSWMVEKNVKKFVSFLGELYLYSIRKLKKIQIMKFADILANIKPAIVAANYDNLVALQWNERYKEAQAYTESPTPDCIHDGYVQTVYDLRTFLRVIIGIDNGTEDLIILDAVQMALNKENGGCKCCGRMFDQDDVFRKQGVLFTPGYCSARCYTRDTVGV